MRLLFIVVSGHQVASGNATDSPYPQGTIKLQQPHFLKLGLDLTSFYPATINAKFECFDLKLIHWHYEFKGIKWVDNYPCEDFRFAKCIIHSKSYSKSDSKTESYPAYIYQPVIATKIGHFQDKNVLEIISVKINELEYGDQYILEIENGFIETN
ncbi:MAG: hypothetical protein HRT37_22530 [Alteromonadaceae bacterium]|nr:hypothetical protein [Alteromonadaceae bacterium]